LLSQSAGIYNFLGRNFKAAGIVNDKEITLLATYLVELSLVDYAALKVGATAISEEHTSELQSH